MIIKNYKYPEESSQTIFMYKAIKGKYKNNNCWKNAVHKLSKDSWVSQKHLSKFVRQLKGENIVFGILFHCHTDIELVRKN